MSEFRKLEPLKTVTLRFADKLIGPVLDKFGEDINGIMTQQP